MLTEQEYVDGEAEEIWYQNDLQLAAELGKTLLERNKDLETQLRHSHEVQTEQAREIDLLSKQLDVLRNVNESRMRIYEEVDRNLHDIEKVNEKLKNESKSDKERIKSLLASEEATEQRCEELQTKVEELQREKREREKKEKRTWSVPSLTEACDLNQGFNGGRYSEFQGFSSYTSRQEFIEKRFFDTHNIFNLKDTVRNLRAQLDREKRKNSDLNKDTDDLAQENQKLEAKLKTLEDDQKKIGTLESELEAMEISAGKLCRMCGGKIMKMSIGSDVQEGELYEHDTTDDIAHGELIRLKNGGSAFGSRESLNMIGLETDDVCMTPVVEVCRDILAAAVREQQQQNLNEGQDAEESSEKKKSDGTEISILGELEGQYRNLVMKYESLIEAKSKKAAKDMATQDDLQNETSKRPGHLALKTEAEAEVQTVTRRTTLNLRSPLDPTDGHFENGPPEYKRLFKEMFQTLRRSVVYEDGAAAAAVAAGGGDTEDGAKEDAGEQKS